MNGISAREICCASFRIDLECPRQKPFAIPKQLSKYSNSRGGTMNIRIMSIAGLALLLASTVGAQTKVSGKQQCGKSEVVGTADAGDKPGHALSLQKVTCNWGTPMEMAGAKSKDGSSVAFVEATSTRSTSTGTYVGNMDSGDKFFVSFHDSAAVKDGKTVGAKGTWMYTGGTGKLKGVKGKGTYAVTMNADGTSTVDVEGDYEIGTSVKAKAPAAKAK
jgi:hypothetical protein